MKHTIAVVLMVLIAGLSLFASGQAEEQKEEAVARRMIPRRHGKIINICSPQSELGRSTIAPYAASKGP